MRWKRYFLFRSSSVGQLLSGEFHLASSSVKSVRRKFVLVLPSHSLPFSGTYFHCPTIFDFSREFRFSWCSPNEGCSPNEPPLRKTVLFILGHSFLRLNLRKFLEKFLSALLERHRFVLKDLSFLKIQKRRRRSVPLKNYLSRSTNLFHLVSTFWSFHILNTSLVNY